MSEPTRLVVGRVRGLHGLGGLVRVEILTDRPEDRFVVGHVLHLEGRAEPLTIASAAAVDDGPGWRVGFREIQGRAAAEPLRDQYLEVVVDRDAELAAGQAFWHEVIGSEVKGIDGNVLGTVADVYRAGEAEVYIVRGGPAGEFDLPAVRTVIRDFAPERGEIVIDEAVLDLAAPAVEQEPRRPRRRHRFSRHGKAATRAVPPADGGAPDKGAAAPPSSDSGAADIHDVGDGEAPPA